MALVVANVTPSGRPDGARETPQKPGGRTDATHWRPLKLHTRQVPAPAKLILTLWQPLLPLKLQKWRLWNTFPTLCARKADGHKSTQEPPRETNWRPIALAVANVAPPGRQGA